MLHKRLTGCRTGSTEGSSVWPIQPPWLWHNRTSGVYFLKLNYNDLILLVGLCCVAYLCYVLSLVSSSRASTEFLRLAPERLLQLKDSSSVVAGPDWRAHTASLPFSTEIRRKKKKEKRSNIKKAASRVINQTAQTHKHLHKDKPCWNSF